MKPVAITDEASFKADSQPGRTGVAIADEAGFKPDPGAHPLAAPEEPGRVMSFLRGAKQGATLGFGDEISGALESAFSDKSYTQARDEARANDKAAQGAHPWLYGAGGIAGGAASAFVPGLNVAKAGTAIAGARGILAGAGTAAKIGAGFGAVSGLGSSDADLTQGEFGRAALHTGIGAVLGGATGGVLQGASNVVGREAGHRAANYASKELLAAQGESEAAFKQASKKLGTLVAEEGKPVAGESAGRAAAKSHVNEKALAVLQGPGAQNSTKGRVMGSDAGLAKVEKTLAGDRELRASIMDASESAKPALAVVEKRLVKHTARADKAIDVAQDMTPGVRITDVMAPLGRMEQELASTSATLPLAKQVTKEIEAFRDLHQETNVVDNVARIPLQQLRKEYRKWQDVAYETANALGVKSERGKIAEQMSQIMRTALHDEIERVAERNPSGGKLLQILRIENEKISGYKGVQRLLEEHQRRINSGSKTMTAQLTGIKEEIKQGFGGVLDSGAASATRAGQRINSRFGPLPGRAAGLARQGVTVGADQAPDTAFAGLRSAMGFNPGD